MSLILINQKDNVYEISFPYDPDIIYLIKNVPGRMWVPEYKLWTIPKNNLGMLLNQFKNTKYESDIHIASTENLNENSCIDSTNCIPDVDISGIKTYVKSGFKLYDHQLDFMRYAIHRQSCGLMSGFILGDDPGAGKTLELINLAMYNKIKYGYKHCLIICCINSSKYNWEKEVYDHTNGEEVGYILGQRRKRDGSIKYECSTTEKLQDLKTKHMYGDTNAPELPYFLITNIESIRARSGKNFIISNEIIDMIRSGQLNMIAIDEVHKNTSPSSQQGKQLLRIKDYTKSSVMWIPITGTPIVSQPTDCFLPLKLVDAHTYTNHYMWCKQFCLYGGYGNHDIVGYKNIPKLKSMLQNNMIRRLKSEILDLPPKIYYTEYVENTSYQNKLTKQVTGEILSNADDIVSSLNPLSQLLRLRQINGSPEILDKSLRIDSSYVTKNAKLKRLLELLEDIHLSNEKVIIFSNWVEPLRTLYRFVSKHYKTCCFTGTMSETERQKHKRVFIENPQYTVMLGTIGAMGTTHTFTVARNIIFYDEPWTAVDKLQAEDRAHRIGTTEPLKIYTLISKDTIDERVHDIIYGKEIMSKYIVDNKIDLHNNPELLYQLLGKS